MEMVCCSTDLCNGDGLLLHGLVDGDSVVFPHLVELVDANHAAVGQHLGDVKFNLTIWSDMCPCFEKMKLLSLLAYVSIKGQQY
jgi:hypothetical protein